MNLPLKQGKWASSSTISSLTTLEWKKKILSQMSSGKSRERDSPKIVIHWLEKKLVVWSIKNILKIGQRHLVRRDGQFDEIWCLFFVNVIYDFCFGHYCFGVFACPHPHTHKTLNLDLGSLFNTHTRSTSKKVNNWARIIELKFFTSGSFIFPLIKIHNVIGDTHFSLCKAP